MTLDDLTPIADYCVEKKLTFKKALQKAISNQLEVYFVCTTQTVVRFGHALDSTQINTIQTREYKACDLIPIPEDVIKTLWGEGKVALLYLLEAISPENYEVVALQPRNHPAITQEDIYVKEILSTRTKDDPSKNPPIHLSPSDTALKVIGLLMHYLKDHSKKYAFNSQPNKSEIKKLLLDLAQKEKVKDYGLSTVDERILSQALKYIEDQRN
jgi:hypothetical protein